MTDTPTEETPQINITDLKNLLSIVDAAIERGAFRPKEISSVGAARDRLERFLDSVAATSEASAPEVSEDKPAE